MITLSDSRGALRRAWLLGTITLTAGAFAVTIMLAPAANEQPVRALRWLLFVGSSVHVGATAWFYTVPEVRQHMLRHRNRYLLVPVGLIAGSAALAGLLPESAFTVPLLGFFAWQFFHFQKQNLGMAALAGVSHGAGSTTVGERRAITCAGIAGTAGIIANPTLLDLRVGADLGWLGPIALAAFAASVLAGVLALRKRKRRPAAFSTLYLISLLFFGPVFVFDSPYAAIAGLTLAHGSQYLLIVGLVAGARLPDRSTLISLGVLLNVALIVGLALNLSSHQHGAAFPGRMLFGAFLGASMAHFVIDAGLWRLRDEFPRRFLTERLPYLLGQPPPQPPAAEASGSSQSAPKITSPRSTARTTPMIIEPIRGPRPSGSSSVS
jgi:hypothetical protein